MTRRRPPPAPPLTALVRMWIVWHLPSCSMTNHDHGYLETFTRSWNADMGCECKKTRYDRYDGIVVKWKP
jgi:hypothetical protein